MGGQGNAAPLHHGAAVAAGVLLIAGGWMLTTLQDYAREVFDLMTRL